MAPSFLMQARRARLLALVMSPAVVIFLSSNIVNVGNLAFNMIFSRWMGPELFGDLAIVLTIKLAFLGVFGAVSSAVSHHVAGLDTNEATLTEQALARLNRICFAALWLALPVVALAIFAGSFQARLDLGSPYLLYILLGSVPFTAPLNILRGVAFGRMNSAKIVYSANIEMAVRLGLGMVAWQMGMGIEGVVAAISVSIIAGWAVLIDVLPQPKWSGVRVRPVATSLGLAAFPFALLQIAQVASLDGDIFLATYFLGDLETGYVAALSLFQRIQFFACFALAGVLLPSVVIALRNGDSYRASVGMIASLLAAVSVTILSLSFLVPDLLLTLLVGPNYTAAAPLLVWVAAAAVVFTINYLIATFLMAQGSRSGIATVLAGAGLQVALMIVSVSAPFGGLAAMLATKLYCQLGVLTVLSVQLWITLPTKPQKVSK
ncbi:MAG: hypothetical protein KJP02_06040 [Octadecabacter sp.]|nr:hypothetical protein [Octadecabacter sp.]